MYPTQIENYPEAHGEDLLRQGRREFGICVRLTGLNDKEAESHGRQSLNLLMGALNWLEGTPGADEAHNRLHEAGRYVRDHFPEGCVLTWTGSGYVHECPVPIAHKRFGFSVGMRVGRRDCSVCGQDISECIHRSRSRYTVHGGPGPAGVCPLCIEEECDHSAKDSYEVFPVALVREVVAVDEISIVSKPRQPDARLLNVPIDTAELQAKLGPGFELGMRVDCSNCLLGCPGFDYLTSDAAQGYTR
jgi:hypothetical protein